MACRVGWPSCQSVIEIARVLREGVVLVLLVVVDSLVDSLVGAAVIMLVIGWLMFKSDLSRSPVLQGVSLVDGWLMTSFSAWLFVG